MALLVLLRLLQVSRVWALLLWLVRPRRMAQVPVLPWRLPLWLA